MFDDACKKLQGSLTISEGTLNERQAMPLFEDGSGRWTEMGADGQE